MTVKDLISNDLSILDNEVGATTYSLPTPPHSDPDSPLSGFGEVEPPQTIDESIAANEFQVFIALSIFFLINSVGA